MTLADLQNRIDEACKETCAYINRGMANLGAEPGEESITDYFLDRMGLKCRGMFLNKKFSRQQEATLSGADWLWWVLLPSGGCCFHVQAKRFASAGQKLDLRYSNKSNVQIEQLMKYSDECGAVPLYVFYASRYANQQVRCNRFVMNGVCFIEASKLFDSYRHNRYAINYNDLIKESWPVPCLMCAFHGSCYNNANGVARTLELNPNHTVPVPDYVTRLVQDGDFDYNTLPHDARNHLSRFDRLVVTDIREIL